MNVGIILLVAVGFIWLVALFFGVIGGVSKTFNTPASSTAINSSLVQSQQEQTIEDTEAKRQRLMDDMKQKMEDARQNQ